MPDANAIEQASIEFAAILRDPSHPINSLDPWVSKRASEEAQERFRSTMGVSPPEPGPSPIDPSSLPALPGDTWSVPKLQAMADAAKEFRVSDQETREWLTHFAQAGGKDTPTAEEAEKALREEWGSRFDDNLRAAWLASQRFSLAVQDDLNRLGNDPKTLRRLAALGQPMVEAERKIQAIMANKKHAWHTGDPKAREEMQALYRIVKGTKPLFTVG